MFLDQKPFIYIWRPVYRVVFAGFLWPSLDRLRALMFGNVAGDLTLFRDRTAIMVERLATIEAQNNSLIQQNAALMARLLALEAEQRNHWHSMSKLLLCLFQQPKNAVLIDAARSHDSTAGRSHLTAS